MTLQTDCAELPFYRDALASALPDLNESEMKLAQAVIGGMAVACEGLVLLGNPDVTSDCSTDRF